LSVIHEQHHVSVSHGPCGQSPAARPGRAQDDDDKAADFIAGMQRDGAAHFMTELMETDHGFNNRRIALQAAVLRWLTALPGAPR
jgi:hypothetical protein